MVYLIKRVIKNPKFEITFSIIFDKNVVNFFLYKNNFLKNLYVNT